MGEVRVVKEGGVGAPADVVYGLIADMREHHPRFLPPAFSDFAVEEGGVGAGTVTRSGARDPPACASTNPSRGTCSPSPTSTPRW